MGLTPIDPDDGRLDLPAAAATAIAALLSAVVVLALLLTIVVWAVQGASGAVDRFCEMRNDCSDVGR